MGGERWPLLFVTGMSGAGKTTALQMFEDLGFEVVDNLPLAMLPDLLDRLDPQHLVVGLDVRSRGFDVENILKTLKQLKADGPQPGLLFLDCSDDVLVQRFSATRHPHPLAQGRQPGAVIQEERRLLSPLHNVADIVVDTTSYGTNDLRADIMHYFGVTGSVQLTLTVLSFGYAHGVPRDVDLLFDMRFLRNPYWVPELRNLNGRDKRVAAYVRQDEGFTEAFQAIMDLIQLLLPVYAREGRAYLTIAFGCTGGQHRSVATAEAASHWLAARGWQNGLVHRELEHPGSSHG